MKDVSVNMNNAAENGVVNIDQAVSFYESHSYLPKGKSAMCYDLAHNEFRLFRERDRDNPGLAFVMDCSEERIKILYLYLDQPGIAPYKESCLKMMKEYKNPEHGFLCFFDHVDDLADFRLFEEEQIIKLVRRWCIKKCYEYTYTPPDPYYKSVLSDARIKQDKKRYF